MTKQLLKTAVFALFLSLFLTSCSELPGGNESETTPEPITETQSETEPTLSELIVGEWNINSINSNKSEWMDNLITAMSFQFGPLTGGKGIIGGSVTTVSSGETFPIIGNYLINETTEQITLSKELFYGEEVTFDLIFQNTNQLVLNGFRQGGGVLTVYASRISN